MGMGPFGRHAATCPLHINIFCSNLNFVTFANISAPFWSLEKNMDFQKYRNFHISRYYCSLLFIQCYGLFYHVHMIKWNFFRCSWTSTKTFRSPLSKTSSFQNQMEHQVPKYSSKISQRPLYKKVGLWYHRSPVWD